MEERLQKILSAAGICSRRTAEAWIQQGRVTVNGLTAKLGDQADVSRDRIAVNGTLVRSAGNTVFLMLHKPRGYVTTLSDEKGRKTAAELVSDCGCRVWPVGRLDCNSEGLLIFTNDGAATYRLTHPRHAIEKEYEVLATGDVNAAIPILTSPLTLDGICLAPANVSILRRTAKGGLLSVVIHQGKYRQVRRICALAGLRVNRLKRVREGQLCLGELPVGHWRYLTQKEIAALLCAAQTAPRPTTRKRDCIS